jgi:Mg/Co/Ni transporter MgtE
LSPRAACRLATLGFTRVHDYTPGKVDWFAHGLPGEGVRADEPTAGSLARHDVATCPLDASAGDVRRAIADSPFGYALVLSPGGVVLGRVRKSALDPLSGGDPIDSVLEPRPQTIRPHLTEAKLAESFEAYGLRTLVVTRPDGTLIEVVRRDDNATS